MNTLVDDIQRETDAGRTICPRNLVDEGTVIGVAGGYSSPCMADTS